MTIYVDASAKMMGDGSKEYPFRTIQAAADLAVPGDEVLVAPGIYREYVNPKNGGTKEQRITYRSIEKGKAHITGAESVKTWEQMDGNVWKAEVGNGLFGDYNPFTTLVYGDWFVQTMIAHTGDVFLNGKSMYEVTSLEEVKHPKKSITSWDPEFSLYTWMTEQDEVHDVTIIYANFGGFDPNQENVEITARRNCFFPKEEGRGYITLSGFEVSQAATQWAPPTAFQDGMIGPHWSKGWIIEDCHIYESKCSGISLGKYLQPNNDNKWSKKKYKDGTQTQRECVCQATYEGWDKEHIGSHIVRRCEIHDCGQTGIVGHLGGVFSLIENNHIHHINNKQNLAGAEIGGIKMHAAIDTVIRNNRIHNCTRGIWLDWQVQGTRVSSNLFYNNCLCYDYKYEQNPGPAVGEDLFIEVSHGPSLVDNNVFLSERAVKHAAQGIAYVNNLICGSFTAVGIGTDNGSATIPSPRYTPYHVPHGTQIVGFMSFLHGDTRFYNNIFVQQPVRPDMQKLYEAMSSDGNLWDENNMTVGTHLFDEYPTQEEWEKGYEQYCGMGSNVGDLYYKHLPVWSKDNVYFNGAKAWTKEENARVDTAGKVELALTEGADRVTLKTNLYELLGEQKADVVSSETLGEAFEPEQRFENPDGSAIVFNWDIYGKQRAARALVGPFAEAAAEFTFQ